jgi:hypothetical protein
LVWLLPTRRDASNSMHRSWRHWGCTTPKLLTNIKRYVDSAEDLDGFEEVSEENQEKLKKGWEAGKVADEGTRFNGSTEVATYVLALRYPRLR